MTPQSESIEPSSSRADAAIEDTLRAVWSGLPAVLVAAPPGAGKTTLVMLLAMQAYALRHQRCMIATQTNEQAFDLARRLADTYHDHCFTLFAREALLVPPDIPARDNLRVVHTEQNLPRDACVVIANAWKWLSIDARSARFDLQVIDEAWQLPDVRFAPIAGLARQIALVGDPGQIAPVIRSRTERWDGDPVGPHVAAPAALVARHPTLSVLSLPVSRRLVQDTVAIVQPVFYPQMQFMAESGSGERGLLFESTAVSSIADMPIEMVADGASLVQVELPAHTTSPDPDPEIADALIALGTRLLGLNARVYDEAGERLLTATMIGIVCAHVSQVSAVRGRMPSALDAVMVETAERWQGLERPVMLAQHPVLRKETIDIFDLNRGRLCVMLSRHRIACIIVTRAGIRERLERYAPRGERVLGIAEDAEHVGWRAHREVQELLAARGRIIPYGSSL